MAGRSYPLAPSGGCLEIAWTSGGRFEALFRSVGSLPWPVDRGRTWGALAFGAMELDAVLQYRALGKPRNGLTGAHSVRVLTVSM
jgi:hypothetical protein